MLKPFLRALFGVNNLKYINSFFISKNEAKLINDRKNFYLQFLGKGETYFDVGANYGNRIQPIINEGIKIVAFEPQVECQKYLHLKYGSKINVVPYGMSSKDEVKTMFISDNNVISTFSEDFIKATNESGRFSQYHWDTKREIELKTLEWAIGQYGKPSFIKIDVEGFESEVLGGLKTPVKFISFEYTVPEKTENALECIDKILKICVDHNVMFNYSIGESMQWALEDWISADEMKKHIQTQVFANTKFGDIYSKCDL